MDRKSLEKDFIMIYPIQHANSFPKTNGKYEKAVERRQIDEAEQIKEDDDYYKDEQKDDKNQEKAHQFVANIKKLSSIKECKSMSPKLRKDWLNEFISTVENWDHGCKEVKALEKKHGKLKSNVALVLKSVEHMSKCKKLRVEKLKF